MTNEPQNDDVVSAPETTETEVTAAPETEEEKTEETQPATEAPAE